MRSIGPGVKEIRIHVLGEWRIVYVAKMINAICALHAFRKKSQKTNMNNIKLARKRFKEIGGE